MIFDFFKGTLVSAGENSVVVETGGVGYRLLVSFNTRAALPKKGAGILIYSHLHVKEGGLELYGFMTESERSAFLKLITVSGVGPKVALAILSDLSYEKLALAIIAGDEKLLSRAPGVGKKTAARIVLELKDKLSPGDAGIENPDIFEPATIISGGNKSEAIAALTVLGYSQSEAVKSISPQSDELSVEQLIKNSLKNLVKR